MALDYKAIEKYLGKVRKIESDLDEQKKLTNPEWLIEMRQVTKELEDNIETIKNDSRRLSIGIIGAVKAGKSSFLNALIFDGEAYLPKAATPMTAALTKITYSDNPKAKIHFYTREDWETIENQSQLYDNGLATAYKQYREEIARKNDLNPQFQKIPMAKEEYEKQIFSKKCTENQRGAKELTRMATDPALMEKLGTTDEFEGDIISKLSDYVGAKGRYTPIVSYVELQVDNEKVKDFEIVDTPGLNDPILSRGIRTKGFLRSCDVVLLLSPCSQFMDAQTVRLMADSLPYAGVKEILVVGSKLDSGVLNEDPDKYSFRAAYIKSLESYNKQFSSNLKEAKGNAMHTDVLDKMSLEKVLYVSSICFTIAQKNKKGLPLDENEKHISGNLHRFRGFEDRYFRILGGFGEVKKALNGVIERKKELIEGKDSGLLDRTRNNHLRILDQILQDTAIRKKTLESKSDKQLAQQIKDIREVIDTSRSKFAAIFDEVVTNCDRNIQEIRPQLIRFTSERPSIAVKTISREETKKVGSGILGLWKNIVYYTIIDKSASPADVVVWLERCVAKCLEHVNREFDLMFNKEEVARKIKEVFIEAFRKGQKEFSEEEILLPLHNILSKITIPHIDLNFDRCIDEVATRFKDGDVKNEEIQKLEMLSAQLQYQICCDIIVQLDKELAKIKKTMEEQAVTFADKIEQALCSEAERLQEQVKQSEVYIEKYRQLAEDLRVMKASIYK